MHARSWTQNPLLPPCSYYFEGSEFKGMGSPHTSHRMAWALGIYTEVSSGFGVLCRGFWAVLSELYKWSHQTMQPFCVAPH